MRCCSLTWLIHFIIKFDMINNTSVNASPSVCSYSVKKIIYERDNCAKTSMRTRRHILAQENKIFNRNDSCVTAVTLYPANDEPVSMVA